MNVPLTPSSAESSAEIAMLPGYKPSGKIGRLGLLYLLLTLLILPPLAAFLYVRTAHFGGSLFSSIYVLVFTSAVLGAVVGAGFYPAIHWGKVRNVPLAVAFGLLAGALALPLAMTIEAMDHREELSNSIQGQRGESSQANTTDPATLSPLQIAQLYWNARAEGGMEVTGRRGREANIDGGMFWALTGIQWLLAGLTAGVGALLLANRRFSEQEDRWFISKTIYSVLPHHLSELIALGSAGDWTRFAVLASQSKDPNFKEFKPQVSVHYLPETPGGILEIRAIPDKSKPIGTVLEHQLTNEQMKIVWPASPK